MAKGDILVRLKADTTNYDPNIAKAKRQLEGFTKENLTAGGALKQLTSGLVSTAAKFASLGAAAAGAMKVLSDAFMSSESNADEWGATMASAQSVYQSFVTSLNNASFSGFLSNIDQVVQAAREAYAAMDELGTRMTVINPERTRLQARATELRATIRREGAGSEAGKAAQAALRALEPALQKSFQTESRLNMDAFTKAVDQRLAEGGIKLDKDSRAFLLKTFSSDEAFSRLKAGARGGIESGTTVTSGTGMQMTMGGRDTRNINAKLLDLFTDEWRNQYSGLLSAAYGARGSAASAMLGNARYLRNGSSGGGGSKGSAEKLMDNGIIGLQEMGGVSIRTTESMKELQAEFARFRDMMANATNSAEYGTAQAGMDDVQRRMGVQDAALRLGVSTESYLAIQDDMQTKLQEIADNIEPIEIKATVNQKTFKLTEEEAEKAAQAIGSIGSALQSIEDPSAKVAGLIATAIANIAATFSGSLKGTFTPWDWIAGAAAGTATMISTIAAIKSATAGSYATGGIIPGNSLSGDNQMAQVNAGEVILTRAQAGIIAGALNGGNTPNTLSCEVSGEQLRFVLNANSQRRGRGEYVTSGSRY